MRKQHAVCGGLGQKGRLGEGVGGKGLEGLRRHLETPGWVDLAGQSWPGSLALLKRRTESPRFSLRCTLHGPPPAGPVADPSGIDRLEQLRVGAGKRQALTQPSLRERRRQTDGQADRQADRQADSHQGKGLGLALDLLRQTVESALRGQTGHSGYRGVPFPAPLSRKPSSHLCSGQKLREAKMLGRRANAAERSRHRRGHILPPESDLQPTHPFSGLRLPSGWLGTQAQTQLPRPGEGLRAEAGGSRKGPVSAWKLRGPASPCPGQASPCQDGARQSSPGLLGGNRARLSGKHAQLRCVDGSSSNRQAVTPTLLRGPPAESRSLGWGKSHALSSQTSLWRFREEGAVSRSLGG